jgi:hypothetical protein
MTASASIVPESRVERGEDRRVGRAWRGGEGCPDGAQEGWLPLGRGVQAGHGGREREGVGVSGVDAAQHGVHEPVDDIVAETCSDQLADGDVLARTEERLAVVGVAVDRPS